MNQTQFARLNALQKWICGFFVATSLMAAAVAQTVTFPTKPVRIIVPQTPGGASDALARIVGQKLSENGGNPL